MAQEEKVKISTVNNFDLVRILAALQVAFTHTLEHLKIENEILCFINRNFLQYFPGVPIFFFLSGFLIFWSFDRNQSSIKVFFRNRFLRLYPALWFCLIVTIILVIIAFPLQRIALIFSVDFWKWIFAQLSFFQFYTPDVLRFWGVGTPNGSLWTIAVELQFYFLVPVLFFVFKKFGRKWLLAFLLLIIISIATNIGVSFLVKESVLQKLASVFILPYLYYFLGGIFLYKNWSVFSKYVEGKFLWWFSLYILYFSIFGIIMSQNISSYWISSWFKLLSDFLLICVVASFGFTKVNLSHRILQGNDVSYGLYIYHMLVINAFHHWGLTGDVIYLVLSLFISVALGLVSWIAVEQRFLKLRNRKFLVSMPSLSNKRINP